MTGMPLVVADLPALREVLRWDGLEPVAFVPPGRRRGLDFGKSAPRLQRPVAAGDCGLHTRHPPQIFAAADDRKLSEPVRRAGAAFAEAIGRIAIPRRKRAGFETALLAGGLRSHHLDFRNCLAFAGSTEPPFKHGATLVEFFPISQKPSVTGRREALRRPGIPGRTGGTTTVRFLRTAPRRLRSHSPVNRCRPVCSPATGAQLNAVMAQLHTVIAELHRHGLAVLVTLLPPAPGGEVAVPLLDGLRGPRFERYVTLSVRIAAELAAVKSGVVALEPMNEPQTECRASAGPRLDRVPGHSGDADQASHSGPRTFSGPKAAGRASTASCCSIRRCCAIRATSSACTFIIPSCSPIRPPLGRCRFSQA